MGYASEKFYMKMLPNYKNEDYAITNMVESFLRAGKEFDDVIHSYSDEAMLKQLVSAESDFEIAYK